MRGYEEAVEEAVMEAPGTVQMEYSLRTKLTEKTLTSLIEAFDTLTEVHLLFTGADHSLHGELALMLFDVVQEFVENAKLYGYQQAGYDTMYIADTWDTVDELMDRDDLSPNQRARLILAEMTV